MLLALDTSTHTSSVALYDEHGVIGETTWRSHENHTRSLMPELVRLMELAGAQVNDIRAIGVAMGPGSFTGLRIGLSAAKGLAFSLNAVVIGVPTLDISASIFTNQELPVWAVLQAGRKRYAAALYENQNGVMQRMSEYIFGTADGLTAQLGRHLDASTERVLVVGEIDEPLSDALHAVFTERVVLASDALNARRAGFLAAMAWRRWQAGEIDELTSLAPYYIPTASLA
ncbi:MAG TPA: tRNA (adenosine(37)-N6)-threonylcarbamoyltransferase complex dimerization subunit type 1 TsaB [Anaerolineae bacterium]|nr:tRNA (adenosine(37)-N6)-threonylcarbamoyltransferase complex dimerization subunit type 1 TsaB [Anaerolineae bacterium]